MMMVMMMVMMMMMMMKAAIVIITVMMMRMMTTTTTTTMMMMMMMMMKAVIMINLAQCAYFDLLKAFGIHRYHGSKTAHENFTPIRSSQVFGVSKTMLALGQLPLRSWHESMG